MTYCPAMLLDTGLVFLSDSRTNAGVDQVNTFRKTTVFERAGERVLVLQVAGNLSISQSVLSHLHDAVRAGGEAPHLLSCSNLHEAACIVGAAVRAVDARDGAALKAFGLEFNPAIILGGQVRGERPRLFNVYAAGNFIEATPETAYFQIGGSKYGKPIIDRVIRRSSSLAEATKCAPMSMDSTRRSNLSVGPPLDLVIVRRDDLQVGRHASIEADNAYFRTISGLWGDALRHAFVHLPEHDWLGERG
jgi:putative proteasome-type protease